MSDDEVRMVDMMTMMIGAAHDDYRKRYTSLFSRAVGYHYAIQTFVQVMRGLMNVGAETWAVGER